MPSVGDDLVERSLRVVRTFIDQLGVDIDEAVGHVDESVREAVRERWERDHDVIFRRVNVLEGSGGPRAWFGSWDPAAGYYWPRLRSWLLSNRGRTEREVEALDDASDQILSHLEDPRPSGPSHFRVQGLVLGHVQSGKTANFTSLIAKAADVGYKLVVVLSGIHNSLRLQTQHRLALELGLEDDPDGVGLPEFGQRWNTLTRSDRLGDFRPGTVDANVLQGNEKVILVVKKNASVLRRLVGWMEGAVAPDLPVLVIDDEADQASINTGGDRPSPAEVDLGTDDMDGVFSLAEEIDPSVINGLLRGLLDKFSRVSYVAYTATPFANVLIDPSASDREVGSGLFPSDFIISLPRPPGYVGAERLFGRGATEDEEGDIDGLDVVRNVPTSEIPYLVPQGRRPFGAQVTPSLRSAIVDYILATAAKTVRLGPGISTMLIHTTQSIAAQIELGELVADTVRELRNGWRYGTDEDRVGFRERWNDEFRPLTVSVNASDELPFEDLEEPIDRLFRSGIDVVVLNSLTGDELDYDVQPERKVIAVGGNRLSRGITLEGLVVSFYVRNSTNYDTLLQMGRWFGFRENYVDVTRLWTTEELYANFRHLALVEQDLRDQIAVYERTGLTPRQLAPRILAHETMQVTAANRMGAGRPVTVSYAGRLIQTSRFRLQDPAWLSSNLDTARRFLSGLGAPASLDEAKPDRRPHWPDVSWEAIATFLSEFMSNQDASSFDSAAVTRYITTQARMHGELTNWWVSVRSLLTPDTTLGLEDLHIAGHGPVNCIARSRLHNDASSVGVLTNPVRAQGRPPTGDEDVGLTREQVERARAFARDELIPLGLALRQQREPTDGLLLLYPISRYSRPGPNQTNRQDLFDDPDRGETVMGVAIAFPPSDSAATRTYIGAPDTRDE